MSEQSVPGGKGIFAAVAVLMMVSYKLLFSQFLLTSMPGQAANRVSATLDDLEKLFERLCVYVERLQVRTSVPLENQSKKIAVKALVEVLKALALATRMLKRGRIRARLRHLYC